MKRYTILYYSLLVTVLSLLTSCVNIKEDRSDCPPLVDPSEEIKTISFEYVGDTDDPAMFSEKISQIDLLVYNIDTGTLVTSQELTGNTFIEQPEATVSLEPGSYRIVAWANTTDDTALSDTNDWAQGRIYAASYPEVYTGNDPLYMGQMDIDMDEEGYAEGTIRLHSAYINMRVLIDNPAWDASNPEGYPQVSMDGLMAMYDMSMGDAMTTEAICTPSLTYNSETQLVESDFNVFRFKDENDCVIFLKDETGNVIASVGITQFLIDNSLSVETGGIYDYREEVTLSILFKFTPTEIIITQPTWEISPTTPTTKLSLNVDRKTTRTPSVDLNNLPAGRSEENKVNNMMIFLTDASGIVKHISIVNPGNFTQTENVLQTDKIRFPYAELDTEYRIYVLANYTKLQNRPTIGQNIQTAIVSIPDVTAVATDNYYPMTTCEPPMLVKFTQDNGILNPAIHYAMPELTGQDETIDISRLASRIDYVVRKTDNIYPIADTDLRVINTAPESGGSATSLSLSVQLNSYQVLHIPNTCYFMGRTVAPDYIATGNWMNHWSFDTPFTEGNPQKYQVDPNWTQKHILETGTTSERATAMTGLINSQWTNTGFNPLPTQSDVSNILAYCTENTQPGTFAQQRGVSTTLQIEGEIIPDEAIPTDATLYVYGKRIYTSYALLVGHNYNLSSLLGDIEPASPLSETDRLSLQEAGIARYPANENGRYPVHYYAVIKHLDNNNNALMGPMEFGTVRNYIYQLAIDKIPLLGHPLEGEPDPNSPQWQDPDERSDAELTLTIHPLPWVEVYKQIEW